MKIICIICEIIQINCNQMQNFEFHYLQQWICKKIPFAHAWYLDDGSNQVSSIKIVTVLLTLIWGCTKYAYLL